MSYCTKQDLLLVISGDELSQLTSETGSLVDDSVVAGAIADADSEIDGYVGVKYSVPLSAPLPARVKKCSVDISIYNLFSRRASRLGGVNETVTETYKNAIAYLKDVSKGIVSLGIAPPPAESTGSRGSFKGDERTFTKDSMKGL